jgi:putative hemolysin
MMNGDESPRLIDLGRSIESPLGRGLWKLVQSPVGRMLSLSAINRIYVESNRLYAESRSLEGGANYFASLRRVLNVQYSLSDEDLAKIPATGPVVVVANHPFGAIEGVILGEILTRARPDVRLLGNHWLGEIPEMREWLISVDSFGGEEAVRANIAPLKSCVRWLKGGGALGVFPAGTVSHLQVRKAAVSDPPWHPTVAALVRRTGATVVPVFFEGRNSMVFQLAGLIHPALRTALLPKELLRHSNSKVAVRIGRPIGPDKLARYPDDQTLSEYLRWKTYMLRRRESPVRPRFKPRPAAIEAALVAPVPGKLLAAEVERLPGQARLCELGDLQVFITEARQIPAVLREIGRLREVTFRAVGEGTGRACDLDRFDETYLHLFMWNRARNEVVGSYRFGRVDDILAQGGVAGLYTSSLFKFRAGFLERLGPALELGRSFIRAEYQRKATSLALMWRGIGEFLVRNPRYKVLFGPVSISRDYQGLSRRLMIEYLETHHGDQDFSPLVKARNPPRERLDRGERKALALVRDPDDVSALVSEIEADNKGMPVLLRHYLRLNARILSFNVDPAFGHCTDGLILVDLRTADPKMLRRFMGEEGHTFYASMGEPT